jgi:hypothetical protein
MRSQDLGAPAAAILDEVGQHQPEGWREVAAHLRSGDREPKMQAMSRACWFNCLRTVSRASSSASSTARSPNLAA